MSKPIQNHSENYYYNLRQKIYDRLAKLPKGTIKERLIAGRKYYYLQRREGRKVLHEYLGRVIPADLKCQLRERQALRVELDKIQSILIKFLSARIKTVI
ncbi:MAG: hypothetical protein ACOY3D_04995 [Candidatus Omnitrophota bacterium]